MNFNGMGMNTGNLWRLSDAESRTISAENPTGEKGGACRSADGVGARSARNLGIGWKISPYIVAKPDEEYTLADISGSGCIQSMWMTLSGNWRHAILRIYWDGQDNPSVECPAGMFFCSGWNRYAQVNSIPIAVNPGKALCCYFEMPFRKSCRITLENMNKSNLQCYYQINYTLTDIPDDAAYFHAQFRRENPVQKKVPYTALDGVSGQGQYVGMYMAISPKSNAWWGEGEVKFYLDDDREYPTICSTGLEDYFCGAYDFMNNKQYTVFSAPYVGMPQVILPDGKYESETRFGLYRFHIPDPIRFKKSLKITVQDLGWVSDGSEYWPRMDDIATVCYWYQTLPTGKFPPLPSFYELDILKEAHPQDINLWN